MKTRQLELKSILFLVFASACWGIGTSVTKYALTEVPSLTLLTIQLSVSVVCLWLGVAISGACVPSGRYWLALGILGWLNPGLSYTFGLMGLAATTASMSALLWATEPVLIGVLSWTILGERPAAVVVGLSVCALVGVLLTVGLSSSTTTGGSALGNGLILLGVGCCALYTVGSSRLDPTLDPLSVIAMQQSMALVWALSLMSTQSRMVLISAPQTYAVSAWISALLSGVLYYALAFWFYLHGLKRVGAVFAGVFINLVPVFGVASAYLFLHEQLLRMQWLGAGMILCAVVLIALWQAYKTRATSFPLLKAVAKANKLKKLKAPAR